MSRKKIQVVLSSLIAVGMLLFLLNEQISKRKSALEGDIVESSNQIVMNTFGRIVVWAQTENMGQECIEAGFEKIRHVEKLMNRYDSNSAISILNATAFETDVKTDDVLFDVLQKSIEYSKKSDGAFDITVKPLIDFWKSCEKSNRLPSSDELKKVHEKIGYEKLILNPNSRTVKFLVDGVSLDLGAIAKGYAIDSALAAIKAKGAFGAMVDVGGDIGCFGKSSSQQTWVIGLQKPNNLSQIWLGKRIESGNILLKLKLTDKAIATSGNYQRYYTIAGKKFSHIIDPATDSGTNDLASVTVIADKAIDADALATTVSVLGIEKGLELIESMPATEAIIITNTNKSQLIKSNGADDYISK